MNFTQQDMKRMQELQTAAMTYRKTLWISEANQSQRVSETVQQTAPTMGEPVGVQDSQEGEDTDRGTPTGSQSGMSILTEKPRSTMGNRRSDEQGVREQGVKYRPTDVTRPPRHRDSLPDRVASLPPQSIAAILNKGAEELSSSVPSSAGKTTPSIPATFQGSTADLPTGTVAHEVPMSQPENQVLLPTDPEGHHWLLPSRISYRDYQNRACQCHLVRATRRRGVLQVHWTLWTSGPTSLWYISSLLSND